jgi:hypothetical protein
MYSMIALGTGGTDTGDDDASASMATVVTDTKQRHYHQKWDLVHRCQKGHYDYCALLSCCTNHQYPVVVV